MPWRRRRRREADQAASSADQTTSDADQTTSDTDQSASDRDQVQADADQAASDRDQAAFDRERATHPGATPAEQRAHELSRVDRAQGTLERHATRVVRAQVASERDQQAKLRDEAARKRDRVAEQRDRAADQEDRDSEQVAQQLGRSDERVSKAFEALAAMRAKAAAQRAQAGADRSRAAKDRDAAAADREHLLAELERAHLDALTGAYRRGIGEVALVHEIERAGRSRGALVLAYLDVDGLKDVNDRQGHAAGDALLRDLVDVIRSKIRPYDPVVRWGGDEFVCTISDTDLESARGRFEGVRNALGEGRPGASVTVGLARLGVGDTLNALIDRADQDLLAARRQRL
jgi:diguanylate cyclase (GGDEF)-like protein